MSCRDTWASQATDKTIHKKDWVLKLRDGCRLVVADFNFSPWTRVDEKSHHGSWGDQREIIQQLFLPTSELVEAEEFSLGLDSKRTLIASKASSDPITGNH